MQPSTSQTLIAVRRFALPAARIALFAVLLWLSAAAGAIPIPGTPVPITLQTFVLMVAGLSLSPHEAFGAVATYLMAGAAGLPVFAGGASVTALFGPSAGFLIGFLPGIVITALLRGSARRRRTTSPASDGASGTRIVNKPGGSASGATDWALTAGRYLLAALLGCVVVVYVFGFGIQSLITGVPLTVVATASLGFVAGDIVKAAVAAAAISGLSKLF